MKAIYHQSTHSLEEMPEMKEPNVLDYDYLEYKNLMDKYQDHIASRKEYPVNVPKEKVKWVDGQILEEGKQFKLEEEVEPYFGWCDVEGCENEGANGGGCWRQTGYWTVCSKHSSEFRKGEPQPKMKQSAIDREKTRGEDGVLTESPQPNKVAIPLIEENKKVEEEKESQDELWNKLLSKAGEFRGRQYIKIEDVIEFKQQFSISKINQNK